MNKKIIPILIAAFMMLSPVSAFAKGFSGGHSMVPQHRTSSSSFSGHGGYSSSSSSSNTYHSGYRSPSSKVNSFTTHNTQQVHQAPPVSTPQKKSGGFLSHALAFGAGTLVGSMFHPFGSGSVVSGSHGFSFMGLFMDLIVIGIGFLILRRLFAK